MNPALPEEVADLEMVRLRVLPLLALLLATTTLPALYSCVDGGRSNRSHPFEPAAAITITSTVETAVVPTATAAPKTPGIALSTARVTSIEIYPPVGSLVRRAEPVEIRVSYVDGLNPAEGWHFFVFALTDRCEQGAQGAIELSHDGNEKTKVIRTTWSPTVLQTPVVDAAVRDVVVLMMGGPSIWGDEDVSSGALGDCLKRTGSKERVGE